MNPKYIEFNADGKHTKANKENRKYYDKPQKNWRNYGASYSADFLKVDIDDFDHKTGKIVNPIHGEPRSDTIVKILDDLSIKYNGINTPNGKHLFFRVPKEIEQENKTSGYLCPLGIKCEWKFSLRDDHIPLMKNGIERPFFKGSIDNIDVDELPPFLYPLQKANAKFKLDFPEGDRTQKLGAYLFYLIKKDFTQEQAFQVIELMNAYVFENPIPEDILKAQILNESTLKKLQEQEKETAEDKISFSDVAKEIVSIFQLITINQKEKGGDFYNYENGVYKPFPYGKITQYITKRYPKKNGNFEREVIRAISGQTYTEIPEDDGTVNVKNGILKFDKVGNVELLPHSPEYISFKQFNAEFDPNAKSKLLDDTLLQWFSGSSQQIELFNQMLGYLLMNNVNYQKVFFFIGAPSTGKSTVLKLITEFCGKENVSSIQLDDFGKPFGLASIINKTANIFSDLRKTRVLASETFKMLADGDALQINRKYKNPISYNYTGKLIFGMNSYPDFSKDFDGIERRLVIFEFKHIFKKDDLQFNPAILDDLCSDGCLSALLNKAVSGYKSLIENKGFIFTKESSSALEDFVSDNDNVVKWLREADITEDYLLREPIKIDFKGLYPEYTSFCYNAGEEPKAQKDFSRTICNKFGFKTKQKRIGKDRAYVYVKK